MNLFCLLAIGWELLSIGNLFCWFQLVGNLFCFEWVGITGFVLGRNVFRKKKISKKKNLLPIAAFSKTQLQENQRLGPWAAFFIKMQPKLGL